MQGRRDKEGEGEMLSRERRSRRREREEGKDIERLVCCKK
jgi:hypothetical protein